MFFNFLFISLTFLFGLLNIGILSTLLIFLRGSLLGIAVGFTVQNYDIKGFIVTVVGIYPQYIIYLPCILLAGVLAILFDRRTNLINRKRHNVIKINLSDYIILFVLIIILMTIASFYEGFISPIFFRL